MPRYRFTGDQPLCSDCMHEDWQHGITGCAVGPPTDHCNCQAHWSYAGHDGTPTIVGPTERGLSLLEGGLRPVGVLDRGQADG